MHSLAFFFIFFVSVSHSYAIIEADYCIADHSLPRGPAGFPCKDPTTITIDDFVFTRFRGERDITYLFGNNVTFALVDQFPGLNGLGLSMARVDLGVGGIIPAHSHRTSEVQVLVHGRIIAGIIDANNVAYYKRLEAGDVVIFPPYLLHFVTNVGETPALAFVALNGANPGFQITSNALFSGSLPAKLALQISAISPEEVKRLQNIFSRIGTTS